MCTEGPSIQAFAMAAQKSGLTTPGILELASLGNHGQNPNHVAHQLQSKYCESPEIDLPMPFFWDMPVLVRTSDGMAVVTRKVGLFLPHEWFHWLCSQEAVPGLGSLGSFWAKHSLKDPQLKNNPVKETQLEHVSLPLCSKWRPCCF